MKPKADPAPKAERTILLPDTKNQDTSSYCHHPAQSTTVIPRRCCANTFTQGVNKRLAACPPCSNQCHPSKQSNKGDSNVAGKSSANSKLNKYPRHARCSELNVSTKLSNNSVLRNNSITNNQSCSRHNSCDITAENNVRVPH